MTNNYDCKTCNKWSKCECGEKGHKNNTSIGYSVGVCKDYVLNELPNINPPKTTMYKDAVDRKDVKLAIYKICLYEDNKDIFVKLFAEINDLPNINSQKIGYWKVDSDKNIIICCNCETWFNNDRLQLMRHCPYCGIEMRGAYETIN